MLPASGALLIGGRTRHARSEAGDTPLFVYDAAIIRRRVEQFRAAFRRSRFALCHESKPLSALLRHMVSKVDGVDVASAASWTWLEAGKPADRISLRGQASATRTVGRDRGRDHDQRGIGRRGRAGSGDRAPTWRRPRLAVRVNPDLRSRDRGCGWAAERSRSASMPSASRRWCDAHREGADWRGFHIFAGSQALEARHHRGAGGDTRARHGIVRSDRRNSAVGQSGRRLRHPLFSRRAAVEHRRDRKRAFSGARSCAPAPRSPSSVTSTRAAARSGSGRRAVSRSPSSTRATCRAMHRSRSSSRHARGRV